MPSRGCYKQPGPCYKQPGPPPPTASCYICLENSSIDQPLLRNCACRGDAGWAHVACLAEFAASKTEEVLDAQRRNGPSIDILPFWETCGLCKTSYMQNMALAIADAFVKQYKHLPDTNKLRFSSLFYMAHCRVNVGDNDGAFELLVCLQEMCDFLTSKGLDVRRHTECVLGLMGHVLFKKEKFNDALPIFEQHTELLVARYGPNSPEVKDNNEMIVILKEKTGIGGCDQTDPAAELVVARQKFKESKECVDIEHRLYMHARLVDALLDDGKIQESMEQSEQLLADSRQSLGPDHPETLRYENVAKKVEKLMASDSSDVWAVIDCEQQPTINGQRLQILRATKEDAQKYVCLIKNDGVYTKFKVSQNQFILEKGTMVVVHGLVSRTDLNGSIGMLCSFDKNNRRYAVSVRKKKTIVSIKPINLNVVFS